MSAHYDTEPPPTASATLHTTVGPIQISLFARQTPLACKNFLQHCLDGYYVGTSFHRVVPDFVIQGGDPTGSGSGGSSIYEDPEFEFDPKDGEKVQFRDEIHSRLKFNRRGLLGMAKSEDGSYGSQFFVTLANAERELNRTCTMFGRVEGDSIYNIVKIAEAELVEGTDRPVYSIKITGCEVGELGPFEGVLHKREKVAVAGNKVEEVVKEKKKKKKGKGAKALLSFGADEEGEEEAPKLAKPKFNPKLVRDEAGGEAASSKKKETKQKEERPLSKSNPAEQTRVPKSSLKQSRSRSRSPTKSPVTSRLPLRDPRTQLPLPNEEAPSRSPTPSPTPPPSHSPKQSLLSRTNAEIAALKASMRRDTTSAHAEPSRKKSALESLIPETSIRGRKRPAPGNVGNGISNASSQDREALNMFKAFKSRLENADSTTKSTPTPNKKPRHEELQSQPGANSNTTTSKTNEEEEGPQEEEQLCDLHFIANCQSCRAWEVPETSAKDSATSGGGEEEDEAETDWMSHTLRFGRDTLGKDLNWKRSHQDDDSLVVIDPRQKEKEVVGKKGRDRERRRKMEGGKGREWDNKRDRK